jgi:hypothetical protein
LREGVEPELLGKAVRDGENLERKQEERRRRKEMGTGKGVTRKGNGDKGN